MGEEGIVKTLLHSTHKGGLESLNKLRILFHVQNWNIVYKYDGF